MFKWFQTEKTTGREYNKTTGEDQPTMKENGEGFSQGSGAENNPELETLREEAAGYETLGAGFGVETGAQAEPRAAAFPVDDVLLGKVWALIFDRVAVGQGAHWKLSGEEENQLALMTKPVLAKYMPSVMSKYGEELCLVASVAMIVAGKMVKGPNEGV